MGGDRGMKREYLVVYDYGQGRGLGARHRKVPVVHRGTLPESPSGEEVSRLDDPRLPQAARRDDALRCRPAEGTAEASGFGTGAGQFSTGRPRPRRAMMLRWTSLVPA